MNLETANREAPDRGHRVEAHTADVILHAWGPDFARCCEEAAMALLELCVDGARAVLVKQIGHPVPVGPADSMLLDLLDEIIFVLDTEADVPFRATVQPRPDGSILLLLDLADRPTVEAIGSAPKAVSRSELTVDDGPEGVRCSFLIDV